MCVNCWSLWLPIISVSFKKAFYLDITSNKAHGQPDCRLCHTYILSELLKSSRGVPRNKCAPAGQLKKLTDRYTDRQSDEKEVVLPGYTSHTSSIYCEKNMFNVY